MGRPDGFMIYERKEQPALSPAQPLSARCSGVSRQLGA